MPFNLYLTSLMMMLMFLFDVHVCRNPCASKLSHLIKWPPNHFILTYLLFMLFPDSHFNNTPSSSTIHLNGSSPSSQPSSVISSHHRASPITPSNEPICSSNSNIAKVDLPLTIITTTSPSSLSSVISASPHVSFSPKPIKNSDSSSVISTPYQHFHEHLCRLQNLNTSLSNSTPLPIDSSAISSMFSGKTLTSMQIESLMKEEQGQTVGKLGQDHHDGGEIAIDLVKPLVTNNHHHVPVIASTAGYNQTVLNSTGCTPISPTLAIVHGAGATEVFSASSFSASSRNIEQVCPFVQSHHLYSPMTITDKHNHASAPNVTVCDTLMKSSQARQQQSSSTGTSSSSPSSTSSAASSILGSSNATEQQSSALDRHSESSNYGNLAGNKSSKDRESPFSSPDEGIDMEDVEVDFKNSSAQSKVSVHLYLFISRITCSKIYLVHIKWSFEWPLSEQ